jgi:hypothetical protein
MSDILSPQDLLAELPGKKQAGDWHQPVSLFFEVLI